MQQRALCGFAVASRLSTLLSQVGTKLERVPNLALPPNARHQLTKSWGRCMCSCALQTHPRPFAHQPRLRALHSTMTFCIHLSPFDLTA